MASDVATVPPLRGPALTNRAREKAGPLRSDENDEGRKGNLPFVAQGKETLRTPETRGAEDGHGSPVPLPQLLGAEGAQGVDLGGAAGREVAGGERGGG